MVTLLDATISVDESGGIASQCCLELTSGNLAVDVTVLLTTGAPGDTADRKLTQLRSAVEHVVIEPNSSPQCALHDQLEWIMNGR